MDRSIGLVDAIPYLRAYSGQIFVVKAGGEIFADPRWRDAIAAEVATLHRLGIRIILVHGGGPQLEAAALKSGLVSEVIAGRRVTTPALLDLAVAEWRGRLSTSLVRALGAAGERAVGLCGADAGVIRAKRRPPVEVVDDEGRARRVDYGLVGDIVEVRVDVLHAVLGLPAVPVITPLAAGEGGEILNVNADTVAAEIAVALRAAKLVLLTRAPGILENPSDPASVLHWTDLEELADLERSGAIRGGMRPKVAAVRKALLGGVPRVHVVDGRRAGALLEEVFTTDGSGTLVVDEADDAPPEPFDPPMTDPVALLADLVAIPSITTDEHAVAAFLAAWFRDRGLPVRQDDRNLEIRVEGRSPGEVLLFSSHLDTVPVGSGWTVDPFRPLVTDGRMTGRGCNDAKASIAAMSVAMCALAADPPPRGTVVFAATCEEERGRRGLEAFLASLGPLSAALVGEPTELQPAVAQNGLVLLELLARGRAGHAARPHLASNAIEIAARDVLALHQLTWTPVDPHVGPMTLAVTQIQAGTTHNVIPGECRMVVDIRTIPGIAAADVVARVRETVASEVTVRSDRLAPARTPEGAAILAAILAELPTARPFGSPTLSDWAHLAGIPAVKWGPGVSEVSHTADEWVELAEVRRAAALYEAVARRFLTAGS